MRVNIYAEEMSEDVEIIHKEIEGQVFTGLRLYLYLPVTVGADQVQGPFMHSPSDNDSAGVTFWGKRDLRPLLRKMLDALDDHYGGQEVDQPSAKALPPGFEMFEGKPMKVLNGDRQGWWRFHEHYDRAGYCDNPARGY